MSAWRLAAIVMLGMAVLLSACESKEYRGQQPDTTIDAEGYVHYGAPKRGPLNAAIAVNPYLWRGSLDTLSFMPLASADVFGGVLISDWYAPPETPNERFKVNVYVTSRQLRADGLRAVVFRQARQDDGNWADASVDPGTMRGLEDAILTRARQLRAQAQIQ